MSENEDYRMNLYGSDVENAILKAKNPDTVPIQNSTSLITSGAVYAAIEGAIGGDY